MRVSRLLLAVATPTTLLGAASLAFSASAPLAVFPDSTPQTPPFQNLPRNNARFSPFRKTV